MVGITIHARPRRSERQSWAHPPKRRGRLGVWAPGTRTGETTRKLVPGRPIAYGLMTCVPLGGMNWNSLSGTRVLTLGFTKVKRLRLP